MPKLGLPAIIFDGEIITLDQKGRPSFNLLQHRFSIADPAEALKRSKQIPAIYMIFDILYIERYSLLKKVYRKTRALLDQFKIADRHGRFRPGIRASGTQCCEAAANLKLEGIIAKRLDSFYEPGICAPGHG